MNTRCSRRAGYLKSRREQAPHREFESAGADLPSNPRYSYPVGGPLETLRGHRRVACPQSVWSWQFHCRRCVPGMSYVVMVQDNARVCLAGPPLVKMATNEDANEEELGGAVT